MIRLCLATACLAMTITASATTSCPTDLTQSHDGHWVSTDAPGWHSSRALPHNVTINTKDFGGAIFVPSQHRIACVYRNSKGFWTSLISNTHRGIQINRHVLDDSGKKAAWRWDSQGKDFMCGRPTVKSANKCTFTVNHMTSK